MPDLRVVARAEVLAGRQGGMLSLRQVLAEGITERELRTLTASGRWQRVTQGVYLTPAHLHRDQFDTARLQAAWMGLLAVPGSTATGMAALMLHGIEGLPLQIPSEVRPPDRQSVPGPMGVTIRRYRARTPVRLLAGFPVAEVAHALGQALGHLDRDHGVAVVDSALHKKRLLPEDLEHVAQLVARRRGSRTARLALALADGRAESPLESKARLRFVDVGLPPTTLQKVFLDQRGRTIARGDLAWQRSDGSWVSVEMDGHDVHSTPEALFHDRHRQNDLMVDRRLTLLRFTGRDLVDRSAEATVRRALAT